MFSFFLFLDPQDLPKPKARVSNAEPVTATLYYQDGWMFVLENKWKKRWCELREGILTEYERQGGKQKKKTSIFGTEITEYQQEKLPCCFKIQSKVGKRILRALTAEEMKLWMDNMRKTASTQNLVSSPSFSDVSHEEVSKPLQPIISGKSFEELIRNLAKHTNERYFESEWIVSMFRLLIMLF